MLAPIENIIMVKEFCIFGKNAATEMKKILFIFLLLFLKAFSMSSQDLPKETNTHLMTLFDSLKTSENDSVRYYLNLRIEKEIKDSIILRNNSFYKKFNDIQNIGNCYSDDGKIRIITWNYPLQDKTYNYSGYLQIKGQKEIIPLQIERKAYLPSEKETIPIDKWYGCLYYKVLKVKSKKGDYYVLLGWAGLDAISNYKVIESLYIDKKTNSIILGKENTFNDSGILKKRIIIQYSEEAKVSLNFDSKNKSIIFDHLVPTDPMYKGIYSFYGPDFTYDAFVLQKKPNGQWLREENVDVKNDK